MDLAFITIWEKYLHTTKNILLETEKSWNSWMIEYVNELPLSDDEYEEQTKRSDFNVFIPTLFLFYHWVELMFKWVLELQKNKIKLDHKISKLYDKIRLDEENKELIDVTKKYIIEIETLPIIWDFLRENNQSIDKFYEMFRYPSDIDKNLIYQFTNLKYNEKKLLPLIRQIITDIDIINKRVVATYRKKNINNFL